MMQINLSLMIIQPYDDKIAYNNFNNNYYMMRV